MKVYTDINGTRLQHGDRVVTISKNGRAKGGNLTFAYFYQPDENKSATLRVNLDNDHYNWNLYKFVKSEKVMKVS